ncbi:MAG: hypothetical protein DHS20C08_13190 [Rhodomicrobium sp.]|nr:MAG: hypothetical protein DHS20C08_13190 [Rhodomicrobium sp.]
MGQIHPHFRSHLHQRQVYLALGGRVSYQLKTAARCTMAGVFFLATALFITGCSQSNGAANLDITSAITPTKKIELDYIHAYAAIASGLKKCWLADKMPLQKSQFFARTKNEGEARKSDIFVHGPAVSPKRGPRIFSVHLKPRGKNTDLLFDNRLLDPLTEAKVEKDVKRWAAGGEGCSDMATTGEITPELAAQKQASRVALPVKKAAK